VFRIKVIKLKSIILFLILIGIIAFGVGLSKNIYTTQRQADQQGQSETQEQVVQKMLTKSVDWQNIILSNQMPAFTFRVSQASQQIMQDTNEVVEAVSIVEPAVTENEHTDDESTFTNTIDIRINRKQIETVPEMKLTGDEQVLIYHTHTREAYKQSSGYEYNEPKAEPYRCDDFDYTVVHVGDILTEKLQEHGVSVLHDITEHEQKELGTAYVRSLVTVENLVEANNDQFDLLIDMHRDGYTDGTQDPDDHVITINGERYAKFFIVIGTGEGQAGGFSIKPDWEQNYQVAQTLTEIANQEYPGIADQIKLQKGRYNQHVTNNMILVEIGSNVTTMDEAERTAELLGDIIYKWFAINNQ
jgi:stage II sporulation protein P